MNKFTSGPWYSESKDHNGQCIVRNEDLEVCTCWHHGVWSIEKEMAANAKLIAAAPELYEVLKELLSSYELLADEVYGRLPGKTQVQLMAEKALAKATQE